MKAQLKSLAIVAAAGAAALPALAAEEVKIGVPS